MILVAFRHGFRASEIIELEWSDIDFHAAEMHVERKKRGKSPRHPIRCDELRALTEDELLAMLRPCADESLKMWPVDRMIDNVKNNGAQLLTPAQETRLI
jgi:hypothetical protein